MVMSKPGQAMASVCEVSLWVLHSGELWPARMLFEDGQGRVGRSWQCRNGVSSVSSVGNSGGVGLGATYWEVVFKVENASESPPLADNFSFYLI